MEQDSWRAEEEADKPAEHNGHLSVWLCPDSDGSDWENNSQVSEKEGYSDVTEGYSYLSNAIKTKV